MQRCVHIKNRVRNQIGIHGKSSAFTLIELLLSVTIIAVMGIASISGFSRLRETQDAETTVGLIKNTLESLDTNIIAYKTSSYEAIFESGSIGFMTNLNGHRDMSGIQCSFDFVTGTGIITGTGSHGSTGSIEVTIIKPSSRGDSFQLSESGGSRSFSFPENMEEKKIEIAGMQNDTTLNSCIIQYYGLSNTQNIPEREVHLIKIEGVVGGTTKQYSSLLVRNTEGTKSLQGSGTTLDSLEKATLTFEKNGKEMLFQVQRKK